MNPFVLVGLAGAALGYLDKSGMLANLPKLPVLNEHGTIALAAYALRGTIPLAAPIMGGALFMSAYELVKQGSISGEAYWDRDGAPDPARRW